MQDAGETTRSIELLRAFQESAPDVDVQAVFLSHGSRLERMVAAAGFDLDRCQPQLPGTSFREDLKSQLPEFVGDPHIAEALIRGERKALERIRPDVVLHGFWPFAGVARQLLGLPAVCFLPVPLHPAVIGSVLKDVPDAAKPLTRLPLPLRRALVRHIPDRLKLQAPGFRQRNIRVAAAA